MENLSIVILCFGFLINLVLVYVISTRKSLHRSLFIFMASFAISDCVQNICMVLLWTESIQTTHSCTLTYLLESITWNFKPILISTVFVTFSMRPDVSRRNSLIIIGVIFFMSVISALPEGFDAELKTDTYGSDFICFSSLTNHPLVLFLSMLIIVAIPATLLIGYSIMKCTSKRFSETIGNSETQLMLIIMLIIYLICWTPYFIFSNFLEKLDFIYVHDFQIFTHLLFKCMLTLMAISTIYKPFLLYLMNQKFKVVVNQIFRREPESFVMFDNQKNDNECTNIT